MRLAGGPAFTLDILDKENVEVISPEGKEGRAAFFVRPYQAQLPFFPLHSDWWFFGRVWGENSG